MPHLLWSPPCWGPGTGGTSSVPCILGQATLFTRTLELEAEGIRAKIFHWKMCLFFFFSLAALSKLVCSHEAKFRWGSIEANRSGFRLLTVSRKLKRVSLI